MKYHAGYAGLIGLPNAGKSTLLNYLVREKVSIVSPKPQTTRRRILGLYSSEQGQIVFVDSPGVIAPEKGLNAFLSREADEVIKDSDVIILVLSLDTPSPEEAQKLIEKVKVSGKSWVAVITKTDLKEKMHREMILREMVEAKGGQVFKISLLKKYEGRDETTKDLLSTLLSLLPESPAPLHDVELFTPETLRTLVGEIIREKCFEFLHEEIPFQVAVRPILFKEDQDIPHLVYEILVAKENHKAIVIGKQGESLKRIGTQARKEIEKLMGIKKIFLELKVTFRKDWQKDTNIMKELGYVHKSDS